MKLPKVLMSLLLVAQLAALPVAAQAAAVNFSPDVSGTTGKLTGKIPLEKLGAVAIPRGRLKIKGNWAEVSTVQEFQFDHDVILAGPVFNTRQRVDKGNVEISGLAYFSQGEWLPYLSPASFEEIVSTDAGQIAGRILSIDNDAAEIRLLSGQQQKVACSAIRDIHSPKAFRFIVIGDAPTGTPAGQPYQTEAYKLSMLQTSRRFRTDALRMDLRKNGDGDLSTGQLVAIGAVIAGLEIAQMAPLLAVPLQTNRLQKTATRREFEVLTSPIGISPQISIPSNMVPPPPGVAPPVDLTPFLGQ